MTGNFERVEILEAKHLWTKTWSWVDTPQSFGVGVGPDFEVCTLHAFRTKICDFPDRLSDLSKKVDTTFQVCN